MRGGIRHDLLLEHDQTSPELGHILLRILDIDLNASNGIENLPHVGSTWLKGSVGYLYLLKSSRHCLSSIFSIFIGSRNKSNCCQRFRGP